MTRGPFTKHFEEMVADYNKVHIVDLLKDLREREMKLTKEYYKLYYESKFKEEGKLDFLHFDFHRFAKGDNFSELRVLIDKLSGQIQNFGWGLIDAQAPNKETQVFQKQQGVFRINCLDSIDRTNVAMS